MNFLFYRLIFLYFYQFSLYLQQAMQMFPRHEADITSWKCESGINLEIYLTLPDIVYPT